MGISKLDFIVSRAMLGFQLSNLLAMQLRNHFDAVVDNDREILSTLVSRKTCQQMNKLVRQSLRNVVSDILKD